MKSFWDIAQCCLLEVDRLSGKFTFLMKHYYNVHFILIEMCVCERYVKYNVLKVDLTVTNSFCNLFK
jgi:hypothetical protein